MLNEIQFVSLTADYATALHRALGGTCRAAAGCGGALLDTSPWQDRRRLLLRGEAHVRAICGLQHVYAAAERQRGPAVDLIAAPVMLADPYGGRPAYFSDVVVRRESSMRSFDDLRGVTWA